MSKKIEKCVNNNTKRRTLSAIKGTGFRVGLAIRDGRPIMALVVVKRIQTVDSNGKITPTWPDNLRARIEDSIENYHEKEEYWRRRAGEVAPAPAPSAPSAPSGPAPQNERDRQVSLLRALAVSASPRASVFSDMLARLRPGPLLREKQLAWAESEAKRFVR